MTTATLPALRNSRADGVHVTTTRTDASGRPYLVAAPLATDDNTWRIINMDGNLVAKGRTLRAAWQAVR